MAKEVKTNAMRILDKNKVPYQVISYECDTFIDGIYVAKKTGVPIEQSFKTIVLKGKSNQYYVFVVPVAEEIDLKKGAKVVGEKSIEMLPVKDITMATGYVRGGCSPIGMKKQYPVFIHNTAQNYNSIYISGGRIGTTIVLNPNDLLKVVKGRYDDIAVSS